MENKDFDSPAHKAMTTTVRYEWIANEGVCPFLSQMRSGVKLKKIVWTGAIPCFRKKFSLIIGPCLLEYGAEVMYSYEGVMS